MSLLLVLHCLPLRRDHTRPQVPSARWPLPPHAAIKASQCELHQLLFSISFAAISHPDAFLKLSLPPSNNPASYFLQEGPSDVASSTSCPTTGELPQPSLPSHPRLQGGRSAHTAKAEPATHRHTSDLLTFPSIPSTSSSSLASSSLDVDTRVSSTLEKP